MYPANRRRLMNTSGLDGSPRDLAKSDFRTDEQKRKDRTRPKSGPTYKIPKTPKDSGFGWGGV